MKFRWTILICIVGLFTAGCDGYRQEYLNRTPGPVFGHYEITYRSVKSRITLNTDGTFHQVVIFGGQRKDFAGTFRQRRAREIDFHGTYNICDADGTIVPLKKTDGISVYTIRDWRQPARLILNQEIDGAYYTKVSKVTIR